MIALGIDPGTRRVGYGVVRGNGSEAVFAAAGILTIKGDTDIETLEETKRGIDALIKKYNPDVFGVEKLYFAKNQKTAIAVAQARGVILLAAREAGIKIREYTPNEIKMGVTGYGAADKKAILKMVRLILGKPSLKVIDDASDALALAILCTSKQL